VSLSSAFGGDPRPEQAHCSSSAAASVPSAASPAAKKTAAPVWEQQRDNIRGGIGGEGEGHPGKAPTFACNEGFCARDMVFLHVTWFSCVIKELNGLIM
jgi:hypothetical protein